MRAIALILPALSLAAPATAAVEYVAGRTVPRADGAAAVEVIALNPDRAGLTVDAPETLVIDGRSLRRSAGQAASQAVPAGGFARLRYEVAPAAAPAAVAAATFASAVPSSADGDRGNAFLGNLSAYEPIYAVYGPGTNTDARIQISFKYQLFGDPGAVGPGSPWLNGVHFAYTQRLYWNLGRKSSPFRNVDYMPEIFYLLPSRPIGQGPVGIGGQAGFRHESNGRDGPASRSLNTVYVQPVATMPLGDYRLTVGPRLWLYAGDLSDNPDIKRFRGNTGLFAEIGQDDGLRISATGRMNTGTGKGAIGTEVSYPLDRIVASNLNLYLFGQAFTGYGENLLDYDRRQTRLRIGIGIVR